MMMPEKEYRQIVDELFKRIGRAFDTVDPDEAEYEYAQGAVTISFADGTKCILSQQPSVRQVWMAAASKGIGFHFNYDSGSKKWLDDKGKNIELVSYLKGLVREETGIELGV